MSYFLLYLLSRFSNCHVHFSVADVLQVEAILDRENFTLEELLDEEEVIQECKALNSRLINLYVYIYFESIEFFCHSSYKSQFHAHHYYFVEHLPTFHVR